MLDRTIMIYSNTVLNATGSVFRSKNGNHVKNGFDKKKSSAKKYSGARNITVTGGTWDAAVPFKNAAKTAGTSNNANTKLTNSSLRFAHCKNLTIKNATFTNNYNSHDIELGGVDGALITGCNFKNSKSMNELNISGGVESVQIDVTYQKAMDHFPAYDNTPCINITVKGNTFTNKYRALGSHHVIAGKPYDNISVIDNKINNAAGIAVNAVFWTNSTIAGNTMTNAGSGIDFYSLPDHNVYNTGNVNYSSIDNQLKNSRTYIYGNTISVRDKPNKLSYKFGIRLNGSEYAKSQKGQPPKGVYKNYNAVIGKDSKGNTSGNKITGSFEAGIAANYCVDSTVYGNKADLTECKYKTTNAYYVSDGENVTVKDNKATVSNKKNSYTRNGLSIRKSVGTLVTENEIKAPDFGIQTLFGADKTVIDSNTISSLASNCVYLSGKEDPTPDTVKTITVTNNELNSVSRSSIPRNDAAINLIFANLKAKVYGNYCAKDCERDVECYIKGGDETAKCIDTDLYASDLTSNPENGKTTLNWEWNLDADGYLLHRITNGTQTLIKDEQQLYEYTDNYTAKNGETVSYSITPYVQSKNITLYGRQYIFGE